MIHKVHLPFLYLILLLFSVSCIRQADSDLVSFETLKTKGDHAFYQKVRMDSSYYYYNLARESLKGSKDGNQTYVLLQMATIQQHIGDFFGSEETVTEALSHTKDTIYKPYLYNMLAVSYDKQKKIDDALVYFKKAQATFKNDTAKAIIQNNIALIYREKKQYHKAIALLEPLLQNKYLTPKKEEMARVIDNLGYTQFKSGNASGYANLSRSLKLRDSLQDILGSMASNFHLAEYFKDSDKTKSYHFATTALRLSKEIDSPDDELTSLKWLIESSDDADVKKYVPDYIRISDSLNLARNSAKNQFAKIKFDSTTALKNLEIEKANKALYLFLFIVAVGSAVLLFFGIRNRNRIKLKSITYQTETRIAKTIHDELANDVFQAMSFAETQDLNDSNKKEALLESLDNIYTRTRNISQHNSEIPTGPDFGAALTDLLNSFNSEKVNVMINNKGIDWYTLSKESKITLYRVLQELMVNMKKHSQGSVAIIGLQDFGKTIEVKYSDNGQGAKLTSISKKGLQNVENRIRESKGTIIFDQETKRGFRVTITFPK